MKRKQFTPEQIVAILREAEAGTQSIAELCRQHGINEVTFYRWRRRYQGMMTVSDAKELKRLVDENARLKKLLAERDLEVDALKAVLGKKA
jgi:putative transposase